VRAVEDGQGPARCAAVEEYVHSVAARKPQHLAARTVAVGRHVERRVTVGSEDCPTVRSRR
jgi:hypothetical protein